MTSELVCETPRRRQMPRGVLAPSDRGMYCSAADPGVLARHVLVGAMSGEGTWYDDGAAEGFFRALKVELVHGERFASRAELRQAVFWYGEID